MDPTFRPEESARMDLTQLTAAWKAGETEPTPEVLVQRFLAAFRTTRDLHSAMSAVNEVLYIPLTYDDFLSRIARG